VVEVVEVGRLPLHFCRNHGFSKGQ
jgi:hypothetical protein